MSGDDFLAEAAELAGIGAYEWDAKSGNVRANHAMFRIWGIAEQSLDFQSQAPLAPGSGEQIYSLAGGKFAELMRLIHPDDVPVLKAAGDQLLAGGSPVVTEYRLLRADGTAHPVRRTARLDRDAQGAPKRILAIVVELERDMSGVVTQRMVRALLEGMDEGTDASSLRARGRGLARAGGLSELAASLSSLASLGVGDVEILGVEEKRYRFVAKDLLGAKKGARATSCELVLGFLEGAVSATAKREALGTERRCRRRGDDVCEFVVQLR